MDLEPARATEPDCRVWAIAASMSVLPAFSTAPSPLYGLYDKTTCRRSPSPSCTRPGSW
ncbi:hypothetical protein ACGFIF_29305 [Kribbella sp. NPDC049174]|uniref:hypothetical protein n=1 Tax=Kribbella sp. NPDC049174 TaxID=3364112 RepID=UPI0037102B1C